MIFVENILNNVSYILIDKRGKFRELAESRTNRAIEAIARIGNLSNRQTYEWDEAEVKKVVRALRDAVSSVEKIGRASCRERV